MIVRRRALDVDVSIRFDDARLAQVVDHLLEDLPQSQRSAAPVVRIAVVGHGPWRVRTPSRAHDATTFEHALTQTLAAVNEAAVTDTPLLAFHAAVVSRGGRSLVVPGRSGTGKSTLTACLLQQGWRYVSDEALALDWSTGRIVGYPRPMALSAWSQAAVGLSGGVPAHGEVLVRAGDLAADVDLAPVTVRQVVLLERSASGAASTVTAVDRNDALVELLARGFTHRHDGARALVVVADLLRSADVLRLRLGDPSDAARLLTHAVEVV